MLVHTLLESSADRHPDKIAIIHDDERLSYNELNLKANSLAYYFNENGIARGDRVALLMANNIEYIVAYYATLKAGAVAAPLNPAVKPDGLQYLLDDLNPSAIVTAFQSERLLKAVTLDHLNLKHLIIKQPKQKWLSTKFHTAGFQEIVSNALPAADTVDQIEETHLANIIYTSGSTGKPKGVMLTHANIVANTKSICRSLLLTGKDIQMVVLPFFYVMGKSLLNTHMAVGGTIVMNNRFMYPADVVNQMVEEKVTSFSGVPSTYAYLLNKSPLASRKGQLNHLRYCSQAGGHMAKSLKRELRDVLPEHTDIVIMYGATEASARLTYLDPAHYQLKMESIGKPISKVSIRLIDKSGNEVPDGQEGELVASGPNIMQGYWNDQNATKRVLNANGYYTGDIGYRDADGFLFVTRRKDSQLKVSGHRINPTEIEDFLMATNLIIETAVIGLPDKLQGNKLVALIVPKEESIQTQKLIELCGDGLPKHKCPAQFAVINGIPKNANGKVDLNKCKETALKFDKLNAT